jgi:circadian clock protein KaiC
MTLTSTAGLQSKQAATPPRVEIPKTLTGISGLDEVTGGGFPRGRPTLICGPAGCGKTLLAMEFLVRGITEYDEPGVFIAFEESAADLVANVASMGFDLGRLEADGKLVVDHVSVVGRETTEVGEWDLDGLFLRLGTAIDSVKARRVVIDTIETLFGAFSDTATLRAELHRLFGWLKDKGVTAVITGERGDGTLTRHGIEEYVSDCVIVLDHRVIEQTSTRRLRILKYRGSLHGTNEYPFLIGESGLSVLPITSRGLQRGASEERISTGIPRLDSMFGDGGFYRGSAVLVSGTAGTGKSTLAAQFCDATCSRGERALYFAFEESEPEILRNMASVGIHLGRWVDSGLLQFHCFRPSLLGLEAHLFAMQKLVDEFKPSVVVKDPVSAFLRIGTGTELSVMLTRQVDFMKAQGVTALFTSLNSDEELLQTSQQIASLVDAWLLVKTLEDSGKLNRLLYVRKCRGIAHSNQIREFLISKHGVELGDVYLGRRGALTDSTRGTWEPKGDSDRKARHDYLEQRRGDLERRREYVQEQAATLWRDFEAEAGLVERLLSDGSTDLEDQARQDSGQGPLGRAASEGTDGMQIGAQ